MLRYYELGSWKQTSAKSESKYQKLFQVKSCENVVAKWRPLYSFAAFNRDRCDQESFMENKDQAVLYNIWSHCSHGRLYIVLWHLHIVYQLIEAEWRIYASVKHTNIASDNGLSPVRRQAIISTNADISSIRPWGTYFGDILVKIQNISFKELHLNMSSAKWRPFCIGLNVLTPQQPVPNLIIAVPSDACRCPGI